ncbi:MAG: ATPase, T2SS/T4P/T4SS family [Candidatus Omnitrophica bacterium]|nr:ATPase, T2SS/T4P/T4SS family [Candidatus Omnitrophota bacterium]
MKNKKFTEYLLEENFLSQEELNKILLVQKEKKGSLVELLIESGYIEEPQVLSLLSRYLGMPPVRVLHLNISDEILKIIPENLARQYQVLPIGRIGNTVTIAMADPLNVLLIDDLKTLTACQINPVIAPLSEIKEAIGNYYMPKALDTIEEIVKGNSAEGIEFIQTKIDDSSEEHILNPIDEAPVIKYNNYILEKAVEERTSDILIEPLEKSGRVRFRVDGLLKIAETYPKKMHPFIISRIKVMSNLNITEHRLPQDGRFRGKIHNKEVDFRVSVLPSSMGEKIALRVLDKSTAFLDLGLLGFEEEVALKIKEDSLKPHGLILVCGPTGSGKTTSLYSIMKYIYSPEKNITTVEDPIEYQMKGINQVSIEPSIGLTFASTLRSLLRQDPDVVMIGEIRDAEAAAIAIKAALTGHLVLSTLHTTTSPGSISRLLNMGIEPFLLSSTLVGVLTQRLVRRLCPRCKEAYEVPSVLSDKYFNGEKITLYRPKGCSFCQNFGYKGRLVECEYLQVVTQVKELIANRATEQVLKKEARKSGMYTLRQDGLIKARNGITSLEEVLRTTAPDEPL